MMEFITVRNDEESSVTDIHGPCFLKKSIEQDEEDCDDSHTENDAENTLVEDENSITLASDVSTEFQEDEQVANTAKFDNENKNQQNQLYKRSSARITINGVELSEEESWAGVPDQYKPKFLLNKSNNEKDDNADDLSEFRYKIGRFLDHNAYETPLSKIKRAELEFRLKSKCRQESDAFLKEVHYSIYKKCDDHPKHGSEDYYLAAQNYAICGNSFPNLPIDNHIYEYDIANNVKNINVCNNSSKHGKYEYFPNFIEEPEPNINAYNSLTAAAPNFYQSNTFINTNLQNVYTSMCFYEQKVSQYCQQNITRMPIMQHPLLHAQSSFEHRFQSQRHLYWYRPPVIQNTK